MIFLMIGFDELAAEEIRISFADAAIFDAVFVEFGGVVDVAPVDYEGRAHGGGRACHFLRSGRGI